MLIIFLNQLEQGLLILEQLKDMKKSDSNMKLIFKLKMQILVKNLIGKM